MSVLGLILVGVLGVVIARWLWSRRPKSRERAELTALMRAVDGDQELVERLIFAEMEREEGLSFTQAARRARVRLERDRR